jgi:putative hydrolases of HD superfamily
MNEERLRSQIHFLLRMDHLKHVVRRNYLSDGSRRENSAEHSWHLMMAVLVLGEYADEAFDLPRVMKMLSVHDVVEVEAGDTYCYDPQAVAGQEQRERAAADRIFGLLAEDQGEQFRALWEEFEAHQTPESRFANAVDCFLPLLQNYSSRGRSWQENGVSASQVRERNERVHQGSETLWREAVNFIEDAFSRGLLS